jgi:hypothetical protein
LRRGRPGANADGQDREERQGYRKDSVAHDGVIRLVMEFIQPCGGPFWNCYPAPPHGDSAQHGPHKS